MDGWMYEWKIFLSTILQCSVFVVIPRWSWRGSVGAAVAERWPWMTSPWQKARAQRNTIWGDSDWRHRDSRQNANEREPHLKDKWLCSDTLSLCLVSQLPPCRPIHPQPAVLRVEKTQSSGFCWSTGHYYRDWTKSYSSPPDSVFSFLNLHVPTSQGDVLHLTDPH